MFRILMITLSVAGASDMLYILVHDRPHESEIVVLFIAGISLNIVYLLLHREDRLISFRFFRLFSLWLDAKEKELKRRAASKD